MASHGKGLLVPKLELGNQLKFIQFGPEGIECGIGIGDQITKPLYQKFFRTFKLIRKFKRCLLEPTVSS